MNWNGEIAFAVWIVVVIIAFLVTVGVLYSTECQHCAHPMRRLNTATSGTGRYRFRTSDGYLSWNERGGLYAESQGDWLEGKYWVNRKGKLFASDGEQEFGIVVRDDNSFALQAGASALELWSTPGNGSQLVVTGKKRFLFSLGHVVCMAPIPPSSSHWNVERLA